MAEIGSHFLEVSGTKKGDGYRNALTRLLKPISDRLEATRINGETQIGWIPSKNTQTGKCIKAKGKAMAKTVTSKNVTTRVKKFARREKLEEERIKVTEDNSAMLNTRILKSTIKRVKRYCVENEITIQEFLNRTIVEKLTSERF